jgi:hypothetical protein
MANRYTIRKQFLPVVLLSRHRSSPWHCRPQRHGVTGDADALRTRRKCPQHGEGTPVKRLTSEGSWGDSGSALTARLLSLGFVPERSFATIPGRSDDSTHSLLRLPTVAHRGTCTSVCEVRRDDRATVRTTGVACSSAPVGYSSCARHFR